MTIEATDKMAKARAAKAAKAAANEETTEERRARLMRELAEMPEQDVPESLTPGTVVGEGANARKVPFTRRFFEGNFEMVEFIPPTSDQVILNGVKYAWLKGKRTKIPASHYAVWEDSQTRLEAARRMYDPPADLKTNIAGYTSPIFRMGEGLMEPIPDES